MTKEFKEYCLSCKDHHKRGSLHYCGGIKTVFKYTSGKEVSSLEIVWSDVVADYPNSLLTFDEEQCPMYLEYLVKDA